MTDMDLSKIFSSSILLAPYACKPEHSRGRLHFEKDSQTRTPFQRDRDRIVHSASFRRLQYKTQVFVYNEGDNFRTRLTHSLEVSQVARSISRVLGLDEDLTEVIALAHDLGHTPFGHAGEATLQGILKGCGGFDHNVQSLRVITELEDTYAQFKGLNLTWETLEGVIKHNGPLSGTHACHPERPVSKALTNYVARHDLQLDSFSSAEAQVAGIADDIAYDNHDLQDGLRAGLFSISDLKDVPIAGEAFAAVKKEHPDIDYRLHIYAGIRRMINMMILDVLKETQLRINEAQPQSADDVRNMPHSLVALSEEMASKERGLKKFLFSNMYYHSSVIRMDRKGRRVVKALFEFLVENPECLPKAWYQQTQIRNHERVVADYITGMTDRFALGQYSYFF